MLKDHINHIISKKLGVIKKPNMKDGLIFIKTDSSTAATIPVMLPMIIPKMKIVSSCKYNS
ncbi:MAG: hypothetical protein J7L07_12210 [Candidatus Odinarchaeota archaeon]|nr:hypothetical protein [Candidatus Odinarchaeota archaeon]